MQMTYCKCCLQKLCGEIGKYSGNLVLKLPVLTDNGTINYANLSIDAETLRDLFNTSDSIINLASYVSVLTLDNAHYDQQYQRFAALPIQ